MYTHFVLLLCILGQAVNATTTTRWFDPSCNQFFYRTTAPTGFDSDTNRYICQRYNGKFYFATLYDTFYRIPLYSAYTITDFDCQGRQPSRRDKWFIEPQLEGIPKVDMHTDAIKNRGEEPTVQALNSDYRDTGFDRGHLNPNFHHCNSDRVATFTLTNSIPQDPCFNRIKWYSIEQETKENMKLYCQFRNAQRYVIVGAIPSMNQRIPSEDVFVDDDHDRPTERVDVPSYSWTVSCCDGGTRRRSWWTGAIGANTAEGEVTYYDNLDVMEETLHLLYGYDMPIELFAGGCGSHLSYRRHGLLSPTYTQTLL